MEGGMMKKSMDRGCRRGCGLGCGTVVILVAILWLLRPGNVNEGKVIRLVSNNIGFLNACVANQTYDRVYELKDVSKVTPRVTADRELYIEFECFSFGIAPSSAYWGFYYASDDKPTGYQGESMDLEWDEKDRQWRAEPQGNDYYTKKIADHWYYYKMVF